MDSLSEAIDAAGGIPFLLQTPLRYQDKAGGLNINLQAGQQWLSGEQALQLLRLRGTGSEGARRQRQQELLLPMAQRLSDPAVVPLLPELLQELNNTSDTNLSKGEILSLLAAGLQQPSSMRITRLPLRTEGDSPRLDATQAEAVLGRWLSQRLPSDSDTAVAVMGSDANSSGQALNNSGVRANRPMRRNCRWRPTTAHLDSLQRRARCSTGRATRPRARRTSTRPDASRHRDCCPAGTGLAPLRLTPPGRDQAARSVARAGCQKRQALEVLRDSSNRAKAMHRPVGRLGAKAHPPATSPTPALAAAAGRNATPLRPANAHQRGSTAASAGARPQPLPPNPPAPRHREQQQPFAAWGQVLDGCAHFNQRGGPVELIPGLGQRRQHRTAMGAAAEQTLDSCQRCRLASTIEV